jgi:hypothetical protein
MEDPMGQVQIMCPHRKISFAIIFPSPARMSLSKLSMEGNNNIIYKLFPPRKRVW